MSVKKQFTIHSQSYNEYNLIQNKVIHDVLAKVKSAPESILDLGSGTGYLYNSIDWPIKNYYAVDFSEKMLALHPSSKEVELILGDFNNSLLFNEFKNIKIDRIFSTSSLQWAIDLDATFHNIKNLDVPVSFAIFTSNTFKTIFETANIHPLLRSVEEVTFLANKYFDAELETKNYKLLFDDTKEMFRYIKKSGVSGARNILDYKSMKNLMDNYPLNYLEFEVLFITQ
ncbi:methyltransferase domain-containing protein [uncultured Flavobacterium sp.]|jgi:malonyl-CoA O-methyltransferase|uniref:methyltransferase domain-containing protein n=1 Tax=uncultured Flavobacterium sp. TaxID=165435 RepID=UPI0025994502|nr:methyltransferase domain-containing protein [uncultured Flavobacterium sp.]